MMNDVEVMMHIKEQVAEELFVAWGITSGDLRINENIKSALAEAFMRGVQCGGMDSDLEVLDLFEETGHEKQTRNDNMNTGTCFIDMEPHDFQPRYDETSERTFSSIDKEKTYVCDVCVKCGTVIDARADIARADIKIHTE